MEWLKINDHKNTYLVSLTFPINDQLEIKT
jgi:hypothetical protein